MRAATCGSIRSKARWNMGSIENSIFHAHDDQALHVQSTCKFFVIGRISRLGRDEVFPECDRLLELDQGSVRRAGRAGDLRRDGFEPWLVRLEASDHRSTTHKSSSAEYTAHPRAVRCGADGARADWRSFSWLTRVKNWLTASRALRKRAIGTITLAKERIRLPHRASGHDNQRQKQNATDYHFHRMTAHKLDASVCRRASIRAQGKPSR